MRRRTLLASLLCAVRPSRSAGRIPLRVGVGRYLVASPFYVGYESGYFREAGFDLDVEPETDAAQTIPLMAGGKLDVLFHSPGPALFNAVARGARLRIVAGRDLAAPSCHTIGQIYVRRQMFPQGIRDLRPLRGKKIAVPAGAGLLQFCLDMLLEHAGMRASDVVSTTMSAAECLAALPTGAVDAFVANSTDWSQRMDALQFAAGPGLADVLPGFQYSHIVFGPRLLDTDVAAGAHFLRAYLRGALEYAQGKTPDYLVKFFASNGLDLKRFRPECRDTFVHDGSIRAGDLRRFIHWAVARGLCDTELDPAALIDTRFLERL